MLDCDDAGQGRNAGDEPETPIRREGLHKFRRFFRHLHAIFTSFT
jgi:hypothetical protein